MATVQTIINEARNYASITFTSAQDYLAQAVSASQGLAQVIAPTLADVDTQLDPLDPDNPPNFDDRYVAPINTATVPTYEALYVPDMPDFPTAPEALDTSGLFKQARPVYDIVPFSETAPTVRTDFTYPDAPTLIYPDVPILTDVQIGPVPDVLLPTFDATFDGVEPVVPDASATLRYEYDRMLPVLQGFVDAGVQSWMADYAPWYQEVMEKLTTRLNRDIDGGYAWADPVEQAIFDRQRSRIDAETVAQREQALAQMARAGYVLPQGAISAVLDAVAQAGADRNAQAATEVAIERAKVELQHVQFCMELMSRLGQSLQSLAVNYAGTLLQLNAQALEWAKTMAGTLLEVFRAALDLYRAKMELYRIAAQVYEVELKAALAQFDKYRLELEAAKATMEVNALEVQVYEAQIRAQSERIQAYVAQLQAIKIQADTERLKIELFGEQVKAYTALVGAKESEFNCYKAAISGDAALVDAYATTVNAYRAGVDAASAKANVGIAHSEAIASHNKNLIAQYEAELDTFKAEVSAETARFDGSVRRNAALLDAYRAHLMALVEDLRMQFEQARLNLQKATTQFEGDVRVGVTNASLIMDSVKIVSGTAEQAAQVSGQIAQAAVGGVNTLARLEEGT